MTGLFATSRKQVHWERRNYYQFGTFNRTEDGRSIFHHSFENGTGADHNVASHVVFPCGFEGKREGAVHRNALEKFN
jgi:hypothetical protein